jgi:hypothetical protein
MRKPKAMKPQSAQRDTKKIEKSEDRSQNSDNFSPQRRRERKENLIKIN